MVFLPALEPHSLRRRIQKQGREQEGDLLAPENPYLVEITELYEMWFARYEGGKFRIQTDWLTEKEIVSSMRGNSGEFR
jgi:deoxyadenosine/deoxycytidine kinase